MIRRKFSKPFHGIKVTSGHVYSFKYQAWENDPEPTVIMMYALEGINMNTGHEWRFFQGINFTYIPRSERRRFANDWMRIMSNTKNTRFTWQLVKRKYPFLKHAVRRYFFRPDYYITHLREIPFDQMEKAIVSTWSKDFSKKVKSSLYNKFKAIFGRKQPSAPKTKTPTKGKFPTKAEKQQQKLQRKVYGQQVSGNREKTDGNKTTGIVDPRFKTWQSRGGGI